MMLAPQFSLRRLLTWVSFSALVCLIAAAAARGQLWAVSVLIGLLGLIVIIAVHGVSYGLLKMAGAARDRRQRGAQEDTTSEATPC
jgi:hypothetical protein